MDLKLRVGVAGSGIGRSHIHSFQSLPDQYEVLALAGKDERTRLVGEQYQVPRVIDDFNELCRMDDLDVIDICTPSFLHYEQTLQALEAGKHVVLEKPACKSLREIDGLVAAEQRTGKRIMPIFQNRMGEAAQKLRFLIKEGVTGRATWQPPKRPGGGAGNITTAPGTASGPASWGGALVTLGIHANDVLTSILGPARSVFARMATLVNPVETEDCFSASLEMADGSLASISLTTGSTDQITRLRFVFANLTVESNTRTYSATAEPWSLHAGHAAGRSRHAGCPGTLHAPSRRIYRAVCWGFTRLYTAVRPFRSRWMTLRQAIQLLTCFHPLFSRTQRPVDLPIPADHPYYDGWLPGNGQIINVLELFIVPG